MMHQARKDKTLKLISSMDDVVFDQHYLLQDLVTGVCHVSTFKEAKDECVVVTDSDIGRYKRIFGEFRRWRIFGGEFDSLGHAIAKSKKMNIDLEKAHRWTYSNNDEKRSCSHCDLVQEKTQIMVPQVKWILCQEKTS